MNPEFLILKLTETSRKLKHMKPNFLLISMFNHFVIKSLISSFLVFLLLPICTSIDTINSTHPLKDGDILISNGETFALGFFSLKNSTNRYIGVWYNKISERTYVWVANRDNPLTNSTGLLTVDGTGNLVVESDDDRKVSVWSTNVSVATASNSYGQLLDSGNLVLFRDGVVVWQGFDYPTDTMLPNMKVGWDRKTGLNRFITSWKSPDDPGTGEYSHKFNFNFVQPPQLFLYDGATPIWRTGTWIGRGWSGIPQMSRSFIFNMSHVFNQDEVTMVWGLLNSSVISRMIVTGSGTVDRLTWHESDNKWSAFYSAPTERCDNYNHCGPFGNCDGESSGFECECFPGFEPKSERNWYLREGSNGCTRKSGVNVCGAGEGFVMLARVKVPDMSTARVNMSVGLKECEEMCLRNCSCMGFASGNDSDGGGCISWYGDMNDTRQFPDWGQNLFIRVDAAELAKYSKKSKSFNRRRLMEWLVPSFAAVVLIIFIIIWCTWKKRALRRHHRELFDLKTSLSLEGSTTIKEIDGRGTNADLHIFDLSSLVSATENFDPTNKLGEGGFGSVYKGQLPNGQEIAVKRLSRSSGQGIEEFKNEVTLIAKLQHRNLVRLLGCCIQKDEKMLVYEYLQNKGLDYFLFDKDMAPQLDWKKRFEITLGIVRGLLYLHQDSRLRIIHRDLKASNVLLDASLNPKISDFGLARIFGGDQVEAVTNRVVGTYGYMSPEYAMKGLFSIKSDVFSFGVLLFEIVSGRKNNTTFFKQNSVSLIGHVWELWREGAALNIVDPSMGDSYKDHEVLRCIHVGLLCVEEHANDRPTMSEVAFMLCNETHLRTPNPPAFLLRESNYRTDTGSAKGGTICSNEATMTAVEGR